MTTNEFLKAFSVQRHFFDVYYIQHNRPRVFCADGFSISIQASECHNCTPRVNESRGPIRVTYEEVELGYPSEVDEDLLDYIEGPDDPRESSYGYVPVYLVDKILQKHGGIDISKTKADFLERYEVLSDVDPWYDEMLKKFDEVKGND